MKQKIQSAVFIAAYLFLVYHFIAKVCIPTFLPAQQDIVNDFGSYYAASRLIADGQTPYRSLDNHSTIQLTNEELTKWQMNKQTLPAYIYPSFLAITLAPITKLPFATARLLWSSFCTLCFFGCIALTFSLLKRKPKLDLTTLFIFFIYFASMPTLESFTLGQVNYPVLLLLLLSFVCHDKKYSLLGGGALAIAAVIKISPVLLLLYFLYRRDFRFIAGFLIVSSLAIILMLLSAPSIDTTFIREVLPAISGKIPELNNKALSVWWQFSFINNELANPIVHSPRLASMLSAIFLIGIIVYIAFVFKRSDKLLQPNEQAKATIQFLICCVGFLLVQPYMEIHHLIFAFPAVAYLIVFYTTDNTRWRNYGLLSLIFFLLNNRGENSFRWLGAHWYSAFLSNPQTYGLIIVLVLLSLILLQKISPKPATTLAQMRLNLINR